MSHICPHHIPIPVTDIKNKTETGDPHYLQVQYKSWNQVEAFLQMAQEKSDIRGKNLKAHLNLTHSTNIN